MGRAMALRFARPGMNIVIGDINNDAMATVVSEATALGVEVPDLTDRLV
jgi:NAD(P)-dependent dehydrogenase (short-subunit alcohol dehydrogenase family)